MRERLFAESDVSSYAYHTFLTALGCAGEASPDRARITIDCPAVLDIDSVFWMELFRRVTSWTSVPSFFWREDSPSPDQNARLLLPLGGAPCETLTSFANPNYESECLWPLITTRPTAIAAARDALAPVWRTLGHDASATLLGLIEALTAGR
jgi:hypothetical protein